MRHDFGIALLLALVVTTGAFAGGSAEPESTGGDPTAAGDSGRLQLVATTTFVGDVLSNVAGDTADVRVLMAVGRNPHSYEPAPSDLRTIEAADIVFTNGLGLEEDLLDDIERMAGGRVVEVSAGIEPLEASDDDDAEDDDHDHEVDPHVWMDPNNVVVWVETMVAALADADPANADTYESNGARYVAELREVDAMIRDAVASIPAERRRLVHDHDSFSYFADEYGFETIGTIVPGTSDRAEPSAQEVVRLVEVIRREEVAVIFVGRTASQGMEQLAQTIADEVGRDVRIVGTLTGSLSPTGEPGDTYLAFLRYNVEQILNALGE